MLTDLYQVPRRSAPHAVRRWRPAMFRGLRFTRARIRSEPVVPVELADAYPALADDIRVLDEVVGESFRRADCAAMVNQHRYRRQHVLILLGSTLLTGFGGLQAVAPHQKWPGLLLFLVGLAVTWLSRTAGELGTLDVLLDERMKAER